MVDKVTCELKVAPTVLVERGKEGVKLCLGETDNVGGGFFSELFKVELGGGAKCFKGGCGSGWGQGADNIGVGINGGGLEGVWVDEGNASACRRRRVLGGLGDVDIVGARASGFEEGEAGDNELEGEFGAGDSGGRPGDCGGQRVGDGRVLKTGASWTWVIPSVVGAIEDVVDDLQGGGGVLLVDGVQVRPRGDREGR